MQSINSVIVVWHWKVIRLVSLNQQNWTHKTHKQYIFGVSKARSAATHRFLSSTSGASFQKPNRSPTLSAKMHANFGILSLGIQVHMVRIDVNEARNISWSKAFRGSFHNDPHQVFAGLWMSKVRATWCSVQISETHSPVDVGMIGSSWSFHLWDNTHVGWWSELPTEKKKKHYPSTSQMDQFMETCHWRKSAHRTQSSTNSTRWFQPIRKKKQLKNWLISPSMGQIVTTT